jgi:ribosomal-protein-alanine N-acetyltransferase
MLDINFEPFTEITTARLLLRKFSLADVPAMFALRSNTQVLEFLGREPLKNLDEATALVTTILKNLEDNNGIMWGICLQENKIQLIGSIGFWQIEKENYRAEIGYMLHPQYWNKGFMQEAIKAVVAFGFTQMKLNSVKASINPRNAASAALLEKTGFIREAYFKEDYYFRGEFFDSAVYGILNNQH